MVSPDTSLREWDRQMGKHHRWLLLLGRYDNDFMYTRGILVTTTLWSTVNQLVHSMVVSGTGGLYIHILWTDGYGHECMLTVADSTSMSTETVHMDVL